MADWGGIEAGGAKFVCAIGSGPDDLRDEVRFPTTSRTETLGRAIDYFRQHLKAGSLRAVGVSCFGPVDPDPASPTFGYITATPKPGWSNTDVVGALQRELGLPVGFDTDVNGAALGEHRWGAAQDLDTFVYLTIGAGIGGGGMVNGRLMHGLVHPEMGHMRLPRDPHADPFLGSCPFHADCLEGLASGPAIQRRWGASGRDLPDGHPAWDLEAHYLALALVNITVMLSPKRIIIGGGVMERQELLPKIRTKVQKLLGGYVRHPALLEHPETYIVPPALGNRAGVLGAIALAQTVSQT